MAFRLVPALDKLIPVINIDPFLGASVAGIHGRYAWKEWVRREMVKKSQPCPKLLRAVGAKLKLGRDFPVLMVKAHLRRPPHMSISRKYSRNQKIEREIECDATFTLISLYRDHPTSLAAVSPRLFAPQVTVLSSTIGSSAFTRPHHPSFTVALPSAIVI